MVQVTGGRVPAERSGLGRPPYLLNPAWQAEHETGTGALGRNSIRSLLGHSAGVGRPWDLGHCIAGLGPYPVLWGHSDVCHAPLIGAVPLQEGTAPGGVVQRCSMVECLGLRNKPTGLSEVSHSNLTTTLGSVVADCIDARALQDTVNPLSQSAGSALASQNTALDQLWYTTALSSRAGRARVCPRTGVQASLMRSR